MRIQARKILYAVLPAMALLILPVSRAFADFTVNNATVTFNNHAEYRTSTITINGVLGGGNSKIIVSGNWVNSGAFNSGTSTVAFENSSATSAVTGSTIFYSFVSEAAGKTINFAAGSTQTVTNTFTVTGSPGNLVKLRSSADAFKWYISFPNGAQALSYADIKDSDALFNTVACPYSLDSGNNNANWNIPDISSPTAVTSLAAVAASTGGISLNWTAPGDDGLLGALNNSTFTIQYATYTSVAWSTAAAQVINISTSGVNPGTSQYYTLSNLSANTTYYFRLWTKDNAGNYSTLSNGATVSTLIDTPVGIYMDEVGANSIVASAYAPVFTGLDRPGSGVNIATDTDYGVWGSTGDAWNTRVNMTARTGAAAAVSGGRLYVVGGANGGGYSGANEEYDPVTNNWTSRTGMNISRSLLAAGAMNGKLYAIGGYNGGVAPLSVNEEYDPETDAWSTKAPMPTARERLAVGVTGGKLYAIGGYNSGDKDYNEAYDPATNTWAVRQQMPEPRSNLAVGVIGGKLYAVGGVAGLTSDLNEEYDPVENKWFQKRAMLTARKALSVGVIGGKLYAVGGNEALYSDLNEVYDLLNDTWTTKAAMPTAREGAAAGVINGKLYIAGGFNGGYLGTSQEYRPGVAETFTGLTPNTWYSFRAKARNQSGAESGELLYISTYTMAIATTPASGQPFPKVYSSSVTVDWSSGTAAAGFNLFNAAYKIMASTAPDFSGDIVSHFPVYSAPYTLEFLADNTTYYFRVQAYNAGGMTDHSWTLLGSTRTVKAPPPGVIISTMGAATGDFGGQRSMVRDSQGNLYLAYTKLYNGKSRVFLARSADDGANWADTTPAPIETAGDVPVMNSYDQQSPTLAIDSNNVLHLVWGGANSALNPTYPSRAKCVYSAAPVPGVTWSPYAAIAAPASTNIDGEFNIGVDSKNSLHVIWSRQDDISGLSNILYSVSTVPGTWEQAAEINLDGKSAGGPALAIDSKDVVHIVVKHASANGTTTTPNIVSSYHSSTATINDWGYWENIYTDPGGVNQESPALTITSAGSLMAVWNSSDAANANSQIKYSVKPAGEAWTAGAKAFTLAEAPQRDARVAADALGNVYMVWSGSDTLNPVVNIKAAVYNGAAWSPWENVSDGLQTQQHPRLRWAGWRNNGGGLDLAWNDYDGVSATATIRNLQDPKAIMSPGWAAASWPKPEGCGYSVDVTKDGTGNYTGIQAAVDGLTAELSTTTCVVIRDAGTYTEQVKVEGFKNNGYRLKIMADPALAGNPPAVNPPFASLAAFNIENDSVSVQGINIISTSTVSYGIYASSASVNISSVNVSGPGGTIGIVGILISSSSVISYSSITVQIGDVGVTGDSNTLTRSYFYSSGNPGVWLYPGADYNTISYSTIAGNSNAPSLFIDNSDFNTVTRSYIYNPMASGVSLVPGSDYNTISYSTMVSNASNDGALYMQSSDFNTVTGSYLYNLLGFGVRLENGADYNTISYSTVASGSQGSPSVRIDNSDSNIITRSFVHNKDGNGVLLSNGADSNTISYSTIAVKAAGYSALVLQGSDSNTVTHSNMSSPLGSGAYLLSGSNYNTVSYSTVTSSAEAYPAFLIMNGSSNAISGSYVQGSTAVYLGAATGTRIDGSVLVSTWADGVGLADVSSQGLFMTTSTIYGGAQGAAISLDSGHNGTMEFTSNTISGGRYGLNIAAQTAGFNLVASSMTFSLLTPGATAINFLDGAFISTFTGAAFNSPNIAVNVNGSQLQSGSRVTMRGHTGLKTGAGFENDPAGYVDWPAIASAKSGLWSDPSTWDYGKVPTSADAVIIAAGHVVTVDIMTAVSSTTAIYGTVKASREVSSSWTLTGGDINVNAGGTLDYGAEASPIPAAYLAHLVLSSGAYAGQYGLIVNNGGNFTVRGADKTPYSYATQSISAANILTVYGSTSTFGWQMGDVITIGATSDKGSGSTSSSTITNVTHGADSNTVEFSGAALSRSLTSGMPIIVGNLTRNVLVQSSGTAAGNHAYIKNLAQNATSFVLTHGEFAYLGANAGGKYGITFNGSLTTGLISSSTVRNGYYGIYFSASSLNTLTGNNVFLNSAGGIYFRGASNYNIVTGNNSCSNSGNGIWLDTSYDMSGNNTLTGNNSYSNANSGIVLSADADKNTLLGNNFYSNWFNGIKLTSANNILARNNSYSNSTGISLNGFYNNNTLTKNNFYSNYSYGIYASSPSSTFIEGGVGYNSAGDSLKNTTAEIYFVPGFPAKTLTLKGARVNPAVGISTAGLDVAGASLISYNQDYDTGTLRLWGNYQVAGSTLTLDYTTQLYASTATTPKLMRGIGHSAVVETTYDTYAVSQLITINYRSGAWHVDGSLTGRDMRTFTGSQPSLNVPAGNAQFSLSFTEAGTPQEGDTLDFALTAASNDASRQKKLLFGYSAAGYNNGRSRLEVDSNAGVVLKGKPDGTANTLIDMIAGNSTYYTYASSGAFTAENSSFTNMDQDGIQLWGNSGVAISSSTFDYLGFGPGINSYITMGSLASKTTYYNVAFGLSRSSAGYASVYNVRVTGYDGNLAPVFRKTVPSLGPLWGERYDYDPTNKVKWSAEFPAIPGCGAGLTVAQDENSDYTTIQAAVNALPVDLSTDTCVVIRDTQTYSEQVVVGGFNNNGYRLKIMADPAFVSSAPAVNPPAGSYTAFKILNASVSVQGINIISTSPVTYGIYSSSVSLNISSVNVISGGKITGAGIQISSYSAVSYSSVSVQSATGLYITGSNNEVSFSSLASNVSGNYALFLINSASNTVTRSYISSPSGYAAVLSVGADHNSISYSTMTSDSDSGMGLYLYGASSNTVSNSYILNTGGTGAISDFHSTNNNIVYSTMTGYGYAGLFIQDSLLTTVFNCYVQGSALGAEVIGSTGTIIGGSVLVSTNTDGVSFAEWAGSMNLTLSSSTISSGAQGWDMWLGEDNRGAIDLSSNTMRGGEYGLNIATQTGGAVISITSMTFQSLAAGATAFNFLGGQFVATFTAVAFNSADMAVSVDASLLIGGSRLTMRQAAGEKSGPDYEKDPGNYVDWDGIIAALLAPADAAVGVSQSPGLHARVLDAGGPVQYNYQLDYAETMDSQGSQPLDNFNQNVTQVFGNMAAFSGQDGTIATAGDSYLYNSTATLVFYSTGTSRLNSNMLYYWRVRAKTAETGYFGVWSATSSFITGEAAAPAPANNLAVTNVSLSSPTGLGVTVNFTIRENNVLNGASPGGGAYNTADWIFIKFSTQAGADGTWNHATLAGGGNVPGGTLTVSSDKKGALLNHLATSALWQANASIVWNYAADGVSAANARIKVFAISMVKIPQGEFVYNAGNIGGSNSNNYGGGVQAPVASSGDKPAGADTGWPNGYNSFYLMRYELTQGQYADFLNTVHSSTAAARYSADNMTDTGAYPLKYAAVDRFAAKSNLSTADAWSYLSWAALRPMTEMEFEKAGRDVGADTRKYPWGSTEPDTAIYSPRNEGWPHIRNFMNYNNVGGVLDSGRYASGDVYRTTEQTGLSPWGIADLSGNLAEQVINCTYTSVPENGNGTAIWPNWPAVSSTQKGLRGGCWFRGASYAPVSVRGAPEISWSNSDRNGDVGVRGARTATEQIIIP